MAYINTKFRVGSLVAIYDSTADSMQRGKIIRAFALTDDDMHWSFSYDVEFLHPRGTVDRIMESSLRDVPYGWPDRPAEIAPQEEPTA